jgi:hypothetical protein
MAEPSIAGMAWTANAFRRMVNIIYLWILTGCPELVYSVTPVDRPSSLHDLRRRRVSRSENKLNYGVETRDQFVKDRENQLGVSEFARFEKLLFRTATCTCYAGEAKPKRFPDTISGIQHVSSTMKILFSQGAAFVSILPTPHCQLTRSRQQNFVSVGNIVPNKQGR